MSMISSLPFPDVIRIESSGICNFKCQHCPTSYRKVRRGILSDSTFDLLLHQFTERKFIPRVAVLYHGGEPLLNKKLPQILDKLKTFGVQKTVITTNFSLMTSEMAHALSTGVLDELKVSFDGASPQENDTIRTNGNFDSDHKKLLNFLRINNKTQVKICNVQVLTKDELVKYLNGEKLKMPQYVVELFQKHENVTFQTVPAMVWPGYRKENTPYTIYKVKSMDFFKCKAFNETVTILANGDVVPCCYDLLGDAVLGNIMESTIFEIRNNQKTRTFFSAMKTQENLPEICQNCIVSGGEYLVKTKE